MRDISVAGKIKVLVTYEGFSNSLTIIFLSFSILIFSLLLQRSVAALDHL